MSSLNDKLDKVLESKEAIKTAVNNKGGNITDDTLLSQYDDIINQLEVLTANMKSDIDSLNNSGASYESKLDTALSSINSYLNTLNSYINPSYSSSSSIATTKLANLNNQFSSQLTNLRNAVVNKGGSVSSPYNLPNITTGINGIQTTTTVVDDTIPSNARTYLQDISDSNTFNDTGDAYSWAYDCYSNLRNAYSYLYRAVNDTTSTSYNYPLDESILSLALGVFSKGVGSNIYTTSFTATSSSSSVTWSCTIPSTLNSYDNYIAVRTATSGTSSADGAVYLSIRKQGSSIKGGCQRTSTNAVVLETISRSGTKLSAGTYGCFSGSYYVVAWDN